MTPEARTPQEGAQSTVDSGALAEALNRDVTRVVVFFRSPDDGMQRYVELEGDSLLAYIKQLEGHIELMEIGDMTATSAQWEGAAKYERKRAEAAEARVEQLEGERDAVKEGAERMVVDCNTIVEQLEESLEQSKGERNELRKALRKIADLSSNAVPFTAVAGVAGEMRRIARAALTRTEETCTQCGRNLHDYQSLVCRYCDGTAE